MRELSQNLRQFKLRLYRYMARGGGFEPPRIITWFKAKPLQPLGYPRIYISKK